MRTIKELLQFMLDNQHLFEDGLCVWASDLCEYGYISEKEYEVLKKYIIENKPRHLYYAGIYWWDAYDIAPRIEWIKEHIKKLENEP